MALRRVIDRKEDGSIAVMAAVIVPVVLLVIALALATLVWAASETETQHAADDAALQSAASALLLELPEIAVPASTADLYPVLSDVLPSTLLPYAALPTLSACETVGNPVGAVDGLLRNNSLLSALQLLNPLRTLTNSLGLGSIQTLASDVQSLATSQPAVSQALATLPATCTAVTAPLLPAMPPTSHSEACAVAEAAMSSASYARRFYAGTDGQDVPTCSNGRIRTAFATGTPLLGFRQTTLSSSGVLVPGVTDGLTSVQNALATAGVRLDSVLPNAVCPQVDLEVDQPVREPLFDRSSTPNGRASAKRLLKNAVVVPVFNGLAMSAPTDPVSSMTGGTASLSGSISTPAQNLNPALLDVRNGTLKLLDDLEARLNALTASIPVTQLNGTFQTVSAQTGGTLPAPSVSAEIATLNLVTCLKDTVRQVFDPPPGSDPPPTVQEVFAAAAAAGEPVQLIQVGAKTCDGTVSGLPAATSAASAYSCVQYANGSTASAVQRLTGVYDVPLFDVTPVLLKDLGDGNYRALAVHATQAAGAFRATLVRSATDRRYVAGGSS